MKNNKRYMQNVINSGDLEVIRGLNGSNLLDSFQQKQVTAILKHTGYILDQDLEAKHFLHGTGLFICKALMALGFVAVVSALIGCADTKVVNVDREPDITNEHITNITKIIGQQTISGLACGVYKSNQSDRSKPMLELLANSEFKFATVINQLDIPSSPSNLGFPKFTPEQQDLIGLTDYALDCYTELDVPRSGVYTLSILSDDGSVVYLNGQTVVDNSGLTAPRERSANITLLAGPNKINVIYFQGPHSRIALSLFWKERNLPKQIVPESSLSFSEEL